MRKEKSSRNWAVVIALLCVPGSALLVQQSAQKFADLFTQSIAWGPLIDAATRLTSSSAVFTLAAIGLTVWQYASKSVYRVAEITACAVAVIGTVFFWALMGAFL